MPFASTSHYSLLNALKQAGLKESDVKLLDLEPNDIHAAWKRGDIDAAYVWYPVLNNLVKDGKILTGSDKLAKQGIITADLVVARRDFAKSNKNLVVRYIKALNQANDLDQKIKNSQSRIFQRFLISVKVMPNSREMVLNGLMERNS